MNNKGIIFYSDNRIEEPIKSAVWANIVASGLPITTSFLQPGEERGYPQMVKQIIYCLERSEADYVFFCENDVLYSKSHFDFTPTRDDIYFYNTNMYRWDYPNDRLIGYDNLTSLSQICCNRLLVLEHYKKRLERMQESGLDKTSGKEPEWAKIWGYEPGTKKTRNGGFSDEQNERWQSESPNVDIRHGGTFSPRKVRLTDFKHLPTGWQELKLDQIKEWDLKGMFNL